jgi:hypothetical protein
MGEERKPPQADNDFGMSRRAAAACGKIWSPLHWRDRKWRSFARTDPTHRSESAGVYEKVWFATTIGDLQRDVFIERRAFDGLPAVIFSRPHSTCSVQINLGSRRCPLAIRYLRFSICFYVGDRGHGDLPHPRQIASSQHFPHR